MREKYKLYNNEIELCFDSTTHTYTVNGEIVYGVTSIVGILNKPALIYWAVNKTIEKLNTTLKPGLVIDEVNKPVLLKEAKYAHREHLSGAGDVGSAIHLWLEKYLKSLIAKQVPPELPVNKNIREGIETVLDWIKKYKMEFISSERKIFSKKYIYAGTLDAYALIDGKRTIIDFKTSSDIYPEFFIQTAAYAQAIEEEDNVKIDECWILKVPKDGSEFMVSKDKNREMNFRSFLGCLENYKRIRYLKGKEIEKYKIKISKAKE